MADTTPSIAVRELTHTYPNGFHALKGLTFDVPRGEFLVVIGLSGSGKSTLLRCINRLIEPSGGEILVNGSDVTHIEGEQLRAHRRSMGMIFQQFNLIKRHTVLENVLYGALGSMSTSQAIRGRFTSVMRDEAMQHLRMVGIDEKANVRADALSGGQQQRVAIARALMQHPFFMLADEPVASLDPATSHSVMKHLMHINRELGVTVLCNLHFLSLVREYATRVIALRGGELVFQGVPSDITDEWFRHIYGEDAVEVEIK
jgi:phosphonate transport system ATP-binding protein